MKKTKRCITKKELRKIIAVTNAKDVVIFIDFHNSVCVCKELKEEQFIFENIQFVYVNDINPKFHTLFLFFLFLIVFHCCCSCRCHLFFWLSDYFLRNCFGGRCAGVGVDGGESSLDSSTALKSAFSKSNKTAPFFLSPCLPMKFMNNLPLSPST